MASLLLLVLLWLRRLVLPTFFSTTIILSFIIVRHFQLTSSRCPKRRPRTPNHARREDHAHGSSGGFGSSTISPGDFYVFVLGSGGHTKEMLMMMDDGFHDMASLHRRYIISSGDALSRHHVADYEERLARLCRSSSASQQQQQQKQQPGDPDTHPGATTSSPGSYDIVTVSRARRVHQPFWSAPITTLLSIRDVAPALITPRPGWHPRNLAGGRPVQRFPSLIFSNGPGTGFTVALAVHFMKLFYVVPQDCMKFVYIESWARISTLSLTGKMLYHMGLTDVFVTQHQEVADKYGLCNAGEMVFNARRDDTDGDLG